MTKWLAVLVFALCGCGAAESTCPRDLPASCPADPPSFKSDITPILDGHCTKCHATGGPAADKILTDYTDVHTLRQSVLDQVYGCWMPPQGSPQLSDTDRETLLAWLVCEAPDN